MVDGSNNILVADTLNHSLQIISGDKVRVTTVAGNTGMSDQTQ